MPHLVVRVRRRWQEEAQEEVRPQEVQPVPSRALLHDSVHDPHLHRGIFCCQHSWRLRLRNVVVLLISLAPRDSARYGVHLNLAAAAQSG
ncbi:hypothetical protein GGH95_004237, partial [Coemansia sp. RSA 1836]